MSFKDMESVAQAMVAPGKGILAADESNPTIKKRFDLINTESTEESRRTYREMLFTSPGIADYISGVILYDETIRQKTADGVPFPKLLSGMGILPGIKVDTGAKDLAAFPGEKVTEGLDGLRERLAKYYEMGARFAKWRAVITIGDGIPSDFCLHANAHALARYATLCQEASIVPIVEPEVLMDGNHTLAVCEEVSSRALTAVFAALTEHRVHLPGIVLKPNMIISGTDCADRADAQEVAEATVRCLTAHVPADVPGIAFLSGGQSAEEATEHLGIMNTMGPHPWNLSFSYGRALQAPALVAWGGKDEQLGDAQQVLLVRARLNGLASSGGYTADMETAA